MASVAAVAAKRLGSRRADGSGSNNDGTDEPRRRTISDTMGARLSSSRSGPCSVEDRAELFSLTPNFVLRADTPVTQWGCIRMSCASLLYAEFPNSNTNIFDAVIGLVILANVVLMIHETDNSASCTAERLRDCMPSWMLVANHILLAIYTTELLVRLQVQRFLFFFRSWNLLDFFIVVTGLVGLGFADSSDISKLSMLRIIRVARLVRVAKLLNRMPTLKNMIKGFSGAMSAMMWGLVLILVLLTIWSILAVEFINPVNKRLFQENDTSWCAKAFTTVIRSTLLFFQTLVAGDSWGACAIPIMHEEPWLSIIFALALVSVQLGFTNLVLAIIVDKAAEAREDSHVQKLEHQKTQEDQSIEMWKVTMKTLDKDNDGSVTLEELTRGYHDESVKSVLDKMQIRSSDLSMLFELMDADGSGKVSPDEFLDAFHKAYTQDWRGYMMIMRLQLNKLSFKVQHKLESIEDRIIRLLEFHNLNIESSESEKEEKVEERPPSHTHHVTHESSWLDRNLFGEDKLLADVHPEVAPDSEVLLEAPCPTTKSNQSNDEVTIDNQGGIEMEHGGLPRASSWKHRQAPADSKGKRVVAATQTLDWASLQRDLERHAEGERNMSCLKAFQPDADFRASPPAHCAARSASAALEGELFADLQVLQQSLESRLAALQADAFEAAAVLTRQSVLIEKVSSLAAAEVCDALPAVPRPNVALGAACERRPEQVDGGGAWLRDARMLPQAHVAGRGEAVQASQWRSATEAAGIAVAVPTAAKRGAFRPTSERA